MRASAMPGEVSKQQRHVDPWESDMDVTEAMKVISNLKFEEEANVSVMSRIFPSLGLCTALVDRIRNTFSDRRDVNR
jgi:hypothetical protein